MSPAKRFGRVPQFPCAVKSCPAMVVTAGHRCSVHKVWTNGPHDQDCVKCRRAIVFGDLWRNLDGDMMRPVHSACIGGRAREPKIAKGWAAGLGQF